MKLSNKLYNALKYTAAIALPAVQVAYAGIAALWGFPHTVEVSGSIAIVNTLLGSLVGVSSASYNASDAKYAGQLVVTPQPDGTATHTVQLTGSTDLSQVKDLTLKAVTELPATTMDPRLITSKPQS